MAFHDRSRVVGAAGQAHCFGRQALARELERTLRDLDEDAAAGVVAKLDELVHYVEEA